MLCMKFNETLIVSEWLIVKLKNNNNVLPLSAVFAGGEKKGAETNQLREKRAGHGGRDLRTVQRSTYTDEQHMRECGNAGMRALQHAHVPPRRRCAMPIEGRWRVAYVMRILRTKNVYNIIILYSPSF